MSHMIGKRTSTKSSYDRYEGGGKGAPGKERFASGGKRGGIVTGQHFETLDSPQLDSTKTRMGKVSSKEKGVPGYGDQDKNTMRNPSRPDHQNAYKTTGGSLGKAPEWNTRGDARQKRIKARIIQRRNYSMNHVGVARIMKGNVNANEGAYMHRGGDRQA